jgi:hypothetical protein
MENNKIIKENYLNRGYKIFIDNKNDWENTVNDLLEQPNSEIIITSILILAEEKSYGIDEDFLLDQLESWDLDSAIKSKIWAYTSYLTRNIYRSI